MANQRCTSLNLLPAVQAGCPYYACPPATTNGALASGGPPPLLHGKLPIPAAQSSERHGAAVDAPLMLPTAHMPDTHLLVRAPNALRFIGLQLRFCQPILQLSNGSAFLAAPSHRAGGDAIDAAADGAGAAFCAVRAAATAHYLVQLLHAVLAVCQFCDCCLLVLQPQVELARVRPGSVKCSGMLLVILGSCPTATHPFPKPWQGFIKLMAVALRVRLCW